MSFKMNLDGLEKLKQGLKSIEDTKSITLGELMSPSFVSECSEFKDIQAMFDGSPFKIETLDDLKSVPDSEWDAYIENKTNYPSWGEMRQAALAEWTRKKINLS